MSDRERIIDCVSTLGRLVDARDWDGLREVLADEVDVDYTSLNGGEPSTVPAPDLVAGWAEMLGRLDATQHLIANQLVTVDGDAAACTCNVVGTHVRVNPAGGPLWTVGGRYDIRLARDGDAWRISAITLTVTWAEGNQAIMSP